MSRRGRRGGLISLVIGFAVLTLGGVASVEWSGPSQVAVTLLQAFAVPFVVDGIRRLRPGRARRRSRPTRSRSPKEELGLSVMVLVAAVAATAFAGVLGISVWFGIVGTVGALLGLGISSMAIRRRRLLRMGLLSPVTVAVSDRLDAARAYLGFGPIVAAAGLVGVVTLRHGGESWWTAVVVIGLGPLLVLAGVGVLRGSRRPAFL